MGITLYYGINVHRLESDSFRVVHSIEAQPTDVFLWARNKNKHRELLARYFDCLGTTHSEFIIRLPSTLEAQIHFLQYSRNITHVSIRAFHKLYEVVVPGHV